MPEQFPENKVETISGNCSTIDLVNKSNLTSFSLACAEESKVQINTAYFPGWALYLNNQNITSQVRQYLDQSNGMIQFLVPSGIHKIQAKFKIALFPQTYF